MNRSSLQGETVLVKLVGAANPIPVKINSMDETGLWTQDKTLKRNLLERPAVFPVGAEPWCFVPLIQIEWLMVPDKTVH